MRVVVSGYFGSGNTGDEAILAGTLAAMRAADTDLSAVVVSADPVRTRQAHGVEAVPRMAAPSIWRALRAADGLVSGGGGLLQDRTSARPVAYYTGVMGLARLARRPYVIHAQGLGPIARAPNRALSAMALRGAAAVSLRDPDSIALARELGVRRPISLVPDAVLALRPPRDDGRHLVVAVRSWGDDERQVAPIRDALRTLAVDHEIVALPMHAGVDDAASAAVVDGIPGARVVPADASFADRLALIGSARLVVGVRLHALILAAAAGVPAVGISYDPKVDAFASRVGMPIAGTLDATLDPRRVVDAARRELDADLTARYETVEAMRREALAAAADSLCALRDTASTAR